MVFHLERQRPPAWQTVREKHPAKWLIPWHALDWSMAWLAHLLSRWVLLEVLEYLSTFSVLVVVIFYFTESGDRLKQKHYQAWQVINTAQGKGGSGGRIEALEELNADHVPLVGVDLTDSFLYGINLNKAQLTRSNFSSADLRSASFQSANLSYADFDTANLRGSNLKGANLTHAHLKNADLVDADLSSANLTAAHLDKTDLRNANLENINWKLLNSIRSADLFGARNAPAGFMDWAKQHGAVFLADPDQKP